VDTGLGRRVAKVGAAPGGQGRSGAGRSTPVPWHGRHLPWQGCGQRAGRLDLTRFIMANSWP